MKKIKKILFSVGLCLCLAFTGIFATGCSNVNLTDEQLKKLLEVVDHSDEFMNDSLDLLQKSNDKLDKEKASCILQNAILKLKTNNGNIWDNLTVNTPSGDVHTAYKLSSGKYVYCYNNSSGHNRVYIQGYLDTGSNVIPQDYIIYGCHVEATSDSNNTPCTALTPVDLYIYQCCIEEITRYVDGNDVQKIVGYDENDDYYVINYCFDGVFFNVPHVTGCLEYKIDKNSRICSLKLSLLGEITFEQDGEGHYAHDIEYIYRVFQGEYILSYGNVSENEMIAKLTACGVDLANII